MKVTVKDLRSGRERAIPSKQAEVLVKLGRVTYLTRDMVATPSSPAALTGEVDSAGQLWNEALHVSTKLKNSDGTWRKRPGAKAAE